MGPSHSDGTTRRRNLQLSVRQQIIIISLEYNVITILVAWSSDASPVFVSQCTDHPGPRVQLPSDPLGLFSLFFDDTLVDLIVEETNKYAELKLQGTGKEWSTDAQEIRAYMGFMILMGINQLPEIRDYWSTNDFLHYAPIANRISRDRFEQISRYLHFVDSDTLLSREDPGFSRLQRVDPIIDHLKDRFKSIYYPHCEVSIDEAMIPFKGRSSMKQYLPLKPVKRGFKVWVIADATNGYTYDFNVYTGATAGGRETALGEKVVMKLSESIQGRYHQLYFDNYFTSVNLLSKLLEKNTYACGTIRTNRKQYPAEISEEAKRLTRGGSVFRQSGNLVATAWKDNKVVNIVSTLADPSEHTTVDRQQKDGTQVAVSCPMCVALYNKYMGGVDLGDQLRGSYHVRLKNRKNYKYVFWFLFDVAITNSYILHSFDVSSSQVDHKAFRLKLAEQLIGDCMSRKSLGRPRKRPRPTPHLPTHSKSRRCVYCRDKRSPPRRKESVWVCTACEGHPQLCLTGRDDGSDCFRLWHGL